MNSIVTQRFIKCHDQLKEDKVIRSSRQFAIALDYLPQSLSDLLKGRRDVTIELLRKAIEKYHLNPNYLFKGEEPFFLHESGESEHKTLTIVATSDKKEKVVHVPVQSQSTYANKPSNSKLISNLPSFTLPEYQYSATTHRSFEVSGNQMEPNLFEGDKVICKYIEPVHWFSAIKDYYVYVVVTKTEVHITRLLNRLQDQSKLVLMWDNEFYDPFEVDRKNIREIWQLRLRITALINAPKKLKGFLTDELTEIKVMLKNQNQMIQQIHEQVNGEDLSGIDIDFNL